MNELRCHTMSLSNCPYLIVLPCLLSSDALKMSYDVSFPMVCSLSRHYVSISIGSHMSCFVDLLDCPKFASSFCLIIGTWLVLGSQLAIKISEPNWVYFWEAVSFDPTSPFPIVLFSEQTAWALVLVSHWSLFCWPIRLSYFASSLCQWWV